MSKSVKKAIQTLDSKVDPLGNGLRMVMGGKSSDMTDGQKKFGDMGKQQWRISSSLGKMISTGGTYDTKQMLEGEDTSVDEIVQGVAGMEGGKKGGDTASDHSMGKIYKKVEKGVSDYVHPDQPDPEPADTAAADAAALKAQKEEEARRRMRRMGQSLLNNSAASTNSLGVTNA